MRRLPLHLSHEAREPAYSYACRLAARNGLPNGKFLADAFDIPWSDITSGRAAAVLALADLGDADAGPMLRSTPQFVHTCQVVFDEEYIQRALLCTSGIRFCPECVRDDLLRGPHMPHIRQEWHLDAVLACPVHRVMLQPLRGPHRTGWRMHTVDYLVRGLAFNGPLLSVPDASFEKAISVRLDRREPKTAFDHMDLPTAVRMSLSLGALLSVGSVSFDDIAGRDWQRYAQRGFATLGNGLDSAMTALGDHIELELERGKDGYKATLGGLFRQINNARDDPSWQPVRKAMARLLADRFPSYRRRTLFCGAIAPTFQDPCDFYSKRLNLKIGKFRQVLRTHGVHPKGYTAAMPERLPYYDEEEVRKVFEFVETGVLRAEARSILGVDRGLFERIVDQGLLSKRTLPGMVRGRYLKSDLYRLVAAGKEAVDQYCSPRDGLIPLANLAHRTHINSGDVLRLLLEGRLRRVAQDQTSAGLSGLLFDPVEVMEAWEARTNTGYTLDQVAKRMGIAESAASFLAREGYLQRNRQRVGSTRRYCWCFCRDSLAAFEVKYATSAMLGNELGLPSRRVASFLDREGVRPEILGPKHLKAYARLALGEDILAALKSLPQPRRQKKTETVPQETAAS